MKAIIIFINNFFIILKKILAILFILKALNFYYLFIIFKILFLIIYKSNSIAYLYLQLFMSLRSACGFFKKKLYRNIFTFFYIMRAARHLKQLLNLIIILK